MTKKMVKNILSANVLCLKKKKKRTYSLSNAADFRIPVGASKSSAQRSGCGPVTMLHITEDTPPDMLAGAMDLTVHLPNGRTVKMAVERSTPMMDLLVQITTNNHLQLSNHTLQVLGMAPSVEHSDKVLPFKPNTPIGALDTQHIKVLPKGRTLPAPKQPPPPGHQPFESTFRLKVHLPRNQLYVTRVSRNVHLGDIMKKVCEEKNLDPAKFELKHPGNLEETLDPKLTLSDYQITEIYVVHKGTSNLSQALSSTDIMTLRKEEERKQMHTKTGGGVFNLIFKRNKSSMGSGSISSDTRSLSPTHSDDSRSVTPPGVPAPPIVSPPKRAPPERPKPPQRKRRPAPKPPQATNSTDANQRVDENEEKTPSEISKATTEQSHSSAAQRAINENSLTICHSRNSSDSSGYHEASILSDHNTSLPRTRPKSAFVTGEMQQMALASGSNLNNMAAHSRSTTSLVAGRKKKAPAPPPPPSSVVVPVSPSSSVVSASSEKPNPLVASQTTPTLQESVTSCNTPLDTPHTPTDINTLDHSIEEEKTLESTDSGIAQDKQSDTEKSTEDLRFDVSPIAVEKTQEPELNFVSRTNLSIQDDSKLTEQRAPTLEKSEVEMKESTDNLDMKKSETNMTRVSLNVTNVDPTKFVLKNTKKENENSSEQPKNKKYFTETSETPQNVVHSSTVQPKTQIRPSFLPLEAEKETDTFEIDWQYQLPSPPRAFRDSPTSLGGRNDCDTYSASDYKDSVVTQPELFETSQRFEIDNISETGTLKSEVTSVASEEILNTLSLEHLEKRKSLVYNRELATSLKVTENAADEREDHPKRTQTNSVNTLPNFKITTYNVPKQKIKVFEDDTIRSNVNNVSNLRRSNFAQSMENVSGFSNVNQERKDYGLFRPKIVDYESNIQRSESFFTDRSSLKVVSRSQSHLTLNKFGDGRLEKSSSTFDVSGLQSIGVMRLIQNKLSTPTSSLENLSQTNHPPAPKAPSTILPSAKDKQQSSEILRSVEVEEATVNKTQVEPKMSESTQNIPTITEEHELKSQPKVEKRYHYSGPPTINMATWSERPKVPVHVKEDADYKLGNHDNIVASKLIVNTNNNNVSSNNTVEVMNRRNSSDTTHNSGRSGSNVVIKIDGQTSEITNNHNHFTKNFENNRFQAPLGYRKPFQNINKNAVSYSAKQRPHSIAFDSDFDISRVPVVKSVEFKKPYKDIYTSVTHINPKSDEINHNDLKNKSTEHLHNDNETKVLRVNSFKTLDHQASPVVRGFRNSSNINTVNQRFSWNPSSTLPAKSKPEINFTTNQHVPFSQSTLKRTDSNRLLRNEVSEKLGNSRMINEEELPFSSLPSFNLREDRISKRNVPQNYTPPPPPPPQMSAVTLRKVAQKEITQRSPVDARDMLMESIRGFGGKKGLKSVNKW